jgi:hypothetical protein
MSRTQDQIEGFLTLAMVDSATLSAFAAYA